ncbi:MAG TPA: type II secretion system minor pseudopilin GspI [Steroidobacteraceae bacterium]|nr:type II secretion system minor pseudopilin GspI [Steroidobacteraceae bacterium]
MRGFTLIEVLAALVIVALGMMGVIQAVSQTVSNGAYLRDRTLAHWIAMNRLTEVRIAGQAPEIDESSGEVEYAGERWRWTMEVEQTPVESLRRIDVSVRRADADADSRLASVTGFYGSAIAVGGAVVNDWDAVPGSEPAAGDEQQDPNQEQPADDGSTPDPGQEETDPGSPTAPTQ